MVSAAEKPVPIPAEVSIQDVMRERIRQLTLRITACLVLTASYEVLLQAPVCLALAATYLAMQWLEVSCFSGRKPWLQGPGPVYDRLALALLAFNAVLFGAPTLLLTARLGSWGSVYAAMLLCAALINGVLSTIGCRGAFRASIAPYFIYILLLPVASLHQPYPPSRTLLAFLIGGSIFMLFNVWRLWQIWGAGKAAEIEAVRRYIHERDASERRLLGLTQQDALTGLLNRNVLQARLIERTEAEAPCALLLIDLDGFKYVNDTMGHSAGDVALREIASRLQRIAGPAHTAARLGGDEFGMLLAGVTETAVVTKAAEALITEISQPVLIDGRLINIGASVGIALFPLHGDDPEQLFSNADLALYQAKAEGRHCARLYQPGLRAMANGKVLRDTELRAALEHGQFEMYYQPQICLHDGTLAGAEALLRWRHPEHGLLTPGAFLVALEGGLLSAQVGAWAIETACAQAAAWRAAGVGDFRIGVNLFGAQFRSGNLVEWVAQACAKSGLPPPALEIEITENVLLRHEDDMIGPLQELRGRGFGVAFDDYGTGFASLSMLTRYPVSRLKIDQSFTRRICEGRAEAAIIHAVLELARTLNLRVTAEGVETRQQAEMLVAKGCEEAQGYYFGAPMSAESFAAFFKIGRQDLKPAMVR
jgi:diguanylate cyclase (GGDEF)-like protein